MEVLAHLAVGWTGTHPFIMYMRSSAPAVQPQAVSLYKRSASVRREIDPSVATYFAADCEYVTEYLCKQSLNKRRCISYLWRCKG